MTKPELEPLTGIRALAAWWVVLFHIGGGIPQTSATMQRIFDTGYLGVDLFFVLSGFVIAYNYWDWFERFRPAQYGRFLWMRLARLYPVHLATLLFALGLYAAARFQGVSLHTSSSWTAGQFVQQLLLVQHWSLHPVLSWNYAAWSISCEWLAYLAFPLLVYGATRPGFGRGFRVWVPLALILMCGASQFTNWSASSVGMLRIAADFPAGVAAFLLWNTHGAGSRAGWLAPGAVASVLAILIFSIRWPWVSAHWATLAFPVLIYAIARGRGILSRALASPPVRFWGRASYSLYMTHGLVLMALWKLAPPPAAGTPGLWLGLAEGFCALSLATIATYFFVEEPARRWLRERFPGAHPSVPARIVALPDPAAFVLSR